MMCDVNRRVAGNIKPVALVRMENNRKIVVAAGTRLEPSNPNITTKPDAIATRLKPGLLRSQRTAYRMSAMRASTSVAIIVRTPARSGAAADARESG